PRDGYACAASNDAAPIWKIRPKDISRSAKSHSTTVLEISAVSIAHSSRVSIPRRRPFVAAASIPVMQDCCASRRPCNEEDPAFMSVGTTGGTELLDVSPPLSHQIVRTSVRVLSWAPRRAFPTYFNTSGGDWESAVCGCFPAIPSSWGALQYEEC